MSVLTATALAAPRACAVATNGPSDATDSVALPQVEVVANPLSDPLFVETNPKQARQPLPASDGADYLKTIPGFTSIRNGGTNGDPVLRGMFGSRLNILSNGVPALGACPHRMDPSTSYVAPESYDKVVVIKGPESVLYGPGASAGTVLFERDTARFDAPGMRFNGSLVGGSFGRNDQNIDLTTGDTEGYARIIANHSHQQDYKDGNGQALPSQWDKWNGDAALGLTPDDNTKLEFTAGTGNGYARYAGRSMDGTQFRRESFGLHFTKKNIGGVLDEVDAQLYYNSDDHVMDNDTLRVPDPHSSMPMGMATDVRRETAGGRIAATLHWDDQFQWVSGLDFQANWLDERDWMGGPTIKDKPWVPQATLWNTGVFSELTWHPTAAQRVIAGTRVDTASERDDRTVMSDSMKMEKPLPDPTANDRRTQTLESGFVRYEHDLASVPAMWYAGIGYTERSPDFWELFSPDQGPAGSLNAFAGLQPEKTAQIDMGAQYKSAMLDAWLSAYAGRVRDFILFDYLPNGDTQAGNVNARILGGEVGSAWHPVAPLRIETALAYAWGRDASSGQPLPQMPPLEARLAVDYRHAAWSVGSLLRVVAPQHRYALHQGNVVGQDFGPSSGFAVVSLHMQYALSQSLLLSAGIDNLFDRNYTEHLNTAGNAGFGFPGNMTIDEPGRMAWVRLSARI